MSDTPVTGQTTLPAPSTGQTASLAGAVATAGQTPSAPATASRNSLWRLRFGGVLKSEVIKLTSLRSIWLCTIGVLALTICGAAAYALLVRHYDPETGLRPQEWLGLVMQCVQVPVPFAVLLVAVIGVLTATSEYGSKMILSTLAAAPKRGMLFAAKLTVTAAYSLLLGAAMSFGALLVGLLLLHPELTVDQVPKMLLGTLAQSFFVVAAAITSFGVGMLLRSTAAGVSTMTVLLFVAPISLSVMSSFGDDFVKWLSTHNLQYLGMIAGIQVLDPSRGSISPLEVWVSLAAWMLLAIVPAALLFNRRDAV